MRKTFRETMAWATRVGAEIRTAQHKIVLSLSRRGTDAFRAKQQRGFLNFGEENGCSPSKAIKGVPQFWRGERMLSEQSNKGKPRPRVARVWR